MTKTKKAVKGHQGKVCWPELDRATPKSTFGAVIRPRKKYKKEDLTWWATSDLENGKETAKKYRTGIDLRIAGTTVTEITIVTHNTVMDSNPAGPPA